MPDEPSLFQRLADQLPWNRRKAREREALERELHALDTEPAPPAASAAEAMEAMKRESRARSVPRPVSGPEPTAEAPADGDLRARWKDSGSAPRSNEELRDFGRKKGV